MTRRLLVRAIVGNLIHAKKRTYNEHQHRQADTARATCST